MDVDVKHVVLSSDRPKPTDPRQIFADFQGNVQGKKYAKKRADGGKDLLYRHEARSLLADYARKKEVEQEESAGYDSFRPRSSTNKKEAPSFLTDTVQDRTPITGSKEEVYSQSDSGMFESVLLAYSNHWNLRTSPDDWWFCVIKTISYAVQLNSDKPEVRTMFVDHEGKKDLVVQGTDGWPVSEKLDFESFFNTIGMQIAKNVKVPEYVDGITADFTTTTPVQKIVSQISLMSSLQGYFTFIVKFGCGIPAIEMTGTEDDWKKLLSKLKVLKTLLEPITEILCLSDAWWELVKKIFSKLLDTYRRKPDEDWWSRIISYGQRYISGKPAGTDKSKYTGWIVEFLKGGIGRQIDSLKGDFPSGVLSVPLYIAYPGLSEKGALVAGMVGLTIHESVENDRPSVQPFQGWSLLLPKDSPFRKHQQK